MEYKIFNVVRNKVRIPFLIRIVFAILLIVSWVFFSLFPMVPWFVFITIWVLFLIPWKYIKNVIKIRKNFWHLFLNLNKKKVVKHKFYDLITQIKIIFKKIFHKKER